MINVLLVTIDQWRGDSLGCAGHPCAVTPNIDRLAANVRRAATLIRERAESFAWAEVANAGHTIEDAR